MSCEFYQAKHVVIDGDTMHVVDTNDREIILRGVKILKYEVQYLDDEDFKINTAVIDMAPFIKAEKEDEEFEWDGKSLGE